MKTYKQIISGLGFVPHRYSSDIDYLRTLTLEELKLFKSKLPEKYKEIHVITDSTLIEKFQEMREIKLNKLIY